MHSKNVELLLSRKVDLVSLQFHVKFDDNFQTTGDIENESLWQTKAGFTLKVGTSKKTLLIKKTYSKRQDRSASEIVILIKGAAMPPSEEYTILRGAATPASVGGDTLNYRKRNATTFTSEGDTSIPNKSL